MRLNYQETVDPALVSAIGRLAGSLIQDTGAGLDLSFSAQPCPQGLTNSIDPLPTAYFETDRSNSPLDPQSRSRSIECASTRVVSLDGMISSPLKGLDAFFIGLGSEFSDHAFLCEQIDQLGDHAVLIVEEPRSAERAHVFAKEFQSHTERVETSSASQFAEELASGHIRKKIIIGDHDTIDMMTGFAVASTKSRALAATSIIIGATCLHAPRHTLLGEEGGTEEASLAGGLLSAMIAALLSCKQHDAASSLHNAFYRTLEDNIRTEDIPVVTPYTRRASGSEFVDCVRDRIGETPSRLPVQSYGPNAGSGRGRASGTHLKVV